MITRSQLAFHQTFQPEFQCIAKLLALGEYTGTKEEISEITGIPTGKQKGKVEPNIRYAVFMGLLHHSLTQGVHALSPTPLGQEVLAQDSYLQEDLTRWLCHANVTSPVSGAPQWKFLVHQAHNGFHETQSNDFFIEKGQELFPLALGFSEIFGVTRRCYQDGCFAPLGFLDWEEHLSYLPQNNQYDLLYLYGYTLLTQWELLFPDQREITLPLFQQDIGLARTFGLSEEIESQVLDDLAGEGILSVNRQLHPPTLIATSQSMALLPKLYSRLL
ncbi:MAG: hypothetical protein R3Y63_06870 [Eubacteriales bacterium]